MFLRREDVFNNGIHTKRPRFLPSRFILSVPPPITPRGSLSFVPVDKPLEKECHNNDLSLSEGLGVDENFSNRDCTLTYEKRRTTKHIFFSNIGTVIQRTPEVK